MRRSTRSPISGAIARDAPRAAYQTSARLARPSAEPTERDRHRRVLAVGEQRTGDVDQGQQGQECEAQGLAGHRVLLVFGAMAVHRTPKVRPRTGPAGRVDETSPTWEIARQDRESVPGSPGAPSPHNEQCRAAVSLLS